MPPLALRSSSEASANDARVYTIFHFNVVEDLLSVSPDSNGLEVLAYCRWHIHVSLLLMISIALGSTK